MVLDAGKAPGLGDRAAAFEDWLEAEGGPRLIVERSGAVVWTNAPARRVLSDQRCLSTFGGQLTASSPGEHARLRGFLNQLVGGPEMFVLQAADPADPPVVLIACSLRQDGGDFIGLRLRQVTDTPRLLMADLSPTYRLTSAERQVIRRLVEGETAEGIARTHGQSIDTVRTHIRNIYSKLGVSSREALFARVFQYLFWID